MEKFNGNNFYNWKVKIQLFLMSKNLWGIVDGSKTIPTDLTQLSAWEKREERDKSMIGLTLLDSQLHLIDLNKSSTEMWE